MHDSAKREEDKYLVKEGKQKIAQAKAQALRRKAEEEAHASMAGAVPLAPAVPAASSNTTSEQAQLVEDTMEPQLYEQQAEFYEELLREPRPMDVVEEDAFVGRQLLTTHKRSEKCSAASDKAYDECTNVVYEVYLHCAQIFKGLRL